MTLIDDAKTVLLKAWSIRLAFLGAMFSALEVALPFFTPLDIFPPTTMAILALFASTGALEASSQATPLAHGALIR